ncbi:predicted aminotransferase class-III [gamma proteobacterium HdN1]|nr:predicted aminotransferase class-III [gamma proteobacterium HdN1]
MQRIAYNRRGFIRISTPIGSKEMSSQFALISVLKDLFGESAGEDLSAVNPQDSFLALGFDSLFLTQVALALKKRFKVDLAFRRLLSDLGSFELLAAWLAENAASGTLPTAQPVEQNAVAAAVPAVASAAVPAVAQMPIAQPVAAQLAPQPVIAQPVANSFSVNPVMAVGVVAPALGGVEGLIQQQLQLMSMQLGMLAQYRGSHAGVVQAPVVAAPQVAALAPVAQAGAPTAVAASAPAPTVPSTYPGKSDSSGAASQDAPPAAKPFGAQTKIDITGKDVFTDEQFGHFRQLADEYLARTGKSREFTANNRAVLADPRVASGFRPAIKDVVYPIVVDRSKGTRLWDLDGNEYIDTLCGYGSMYFGYQADWIVDAIQAQLALGMEIGPQHPLTAEVIQLLREIMPHERFAFCNTGSEAVLGAVRMARTRSGCNKIVMFTGDYHGINNEVIVRAGKGGKGFPAAAGVMRESVSNVLVLDYGSDEALKVIREQADDIAAILVEPVQSRHPDFVPLEFLRELRTLTKELNIALIFDEVITGFRAAPGGFQEYSGIQADICTYGKIIGGGISIGVIGGRAHYLDTLDGGQWQYGDDSKPEVGVTYFAGTFVRHPLALAAARAVLLHMKANPRLQEEVNERAARFAGELNLHFKRVQAPMHIERFCSMMYFKFTEDLPWGEFLFTDMRIQGIHIWYGRPMFVSAAHTDAELDTIIATFKRSLARMQAWGFIPGSSSDEAGRDLAPPVKGAVMGINGEGNPAWFVTEPDGSNRQVGVAFEY